MKLRLFPRQEDAYFGLFQAAADTIALIHSPRAGGKLTTKRSSAALSFRVVLVDQCPKARIASQRVPHRIES